MSAAVSSERLAWNQPTWLDTLAAWLLALLWILPLLYAVWTAFHPAEFSTRFALFAPLTLENFGRAWEAALVNTLSPGDTVLLVRTGWFATLWHEMATRLGL